MKNLPRYLRVAAACLLVGFAFSTAMTCRNHGAALTALPLWMRLAVDGVLFLLPAAAAFFGALWMERKR